RSRRGPLPGIARDRPSRIRIARSRRSRPHRTQSERVAHAEASREARDDGQSSLEPVRLTTSAHFAISFLMSWANCSDEPPTRSYPMLPSFSFAASDAIAVLISLFRRCTIAFGTPLGTITPLQVTTSYPGTPASEIVGSSGNVGA